MFARIENRGRHRIVCVAECEECICVGHGNRHGQHGAMEIVWLDAQLDDGVLFGGGESACGADTARRSRLLAIHHTVSAFERTTAHSGHNGGQKVSLIYSFIWWITTTTIIINQYSICFTLILQLGRCIAESTAHQCRLRSGGRRCTDGPHGRLSCRNRRGTRRIALGRSHANSFVSEIRRIRKRRCEQFPFSRKFQSLPTVYVSFAAIAIPSSIQ